MEVKTAAWSTVALVIVAFGAVVIYSIEREGIKSDLTKAGRELEAHEANIVSQTKGLAKRKEDYEALQARVAAILATGKNIEAQQEANRELTGRIEDLRAKWKNSRQAFARDIDVIRAKTRDEVMPELKLVDGKSLKSVRFKQIKDNIVILEHADGIARVPVANMTSNWMGRLALGWNPRLSSELSGQPDAPAPVEEAAAPVPTVAEVRQAHMESVNRGNVKDMENKIQVLQRQITEAENSVSRFSNVAAEYDSKYQTAVANGNSSNYKAKRDQANATVRTLQSQIAAAKQQIQVLMDQIEKKSN